MQICMRHGLETADGITQSTEHQPCGWQKGSRLTSVLRHRGKLRVALDWCSTQATTALQALEHARNMRQPGWKTDNVVVTTRVPPGCFPALSMSFTSEVCLI